MTIEPNTENGLSFGQALDALKTGSRVARAGWNGKGMWIYLNKGAIDGDKFGFAPGEQPVAAHQSTIDGIRLGLFDVWGKGVATRLPNINMRAASGSIVTGWLASQTDMLSNDWTIIL